MWKILCLLVIAQGLKQSSQQATPGAEGGEPISNGDSLPCHSLNEEGSSHNHGDIWQVDKCKTCECQNGITKCDITVCGGLPHESCVEKHTSEDQCCPAYECESLPCITGERSSHNHGDIWKVDKCKTCECQNGTMTCDITVCGGLPHESCVEKHTSEDQCCPEYECDSLPCIDEQGFSHNDGEAWQPDDCQQCNCDNGKQSCNHTICGRTPHESCVEMPASEGQCCPEYQCDSLPCPDNNGDWHNDGDVFDLDKCEKCRCHNGTLTCQHIICGRPQGDCEVIVETEDACCPRYKCVAIKSCRVENGAVYEHGSMWQVGKCKSCECHNGEVVCTIITCPVPQGKYIAVPEPGECCPHYELGGCMKDGKHYAHGEKTSDDPCTWCTCVNGKLFCNVWFCADAGNSKETHAVTESHSRCRRIIPPGTCCPGKEVVCDQPISACPSDAPAVQTACNDHMCLNVSCENHPDAKCTISRCGHCHVIFTDEGEEVDCGNSQNE